ncbi:MAG: ABC transporter ATP-binding protein [Planctomycetota bacterium]|nr:ABC transporter ATP-binding protein [Planctomycetota bacterium]MDA1212078.1 ABC transporter ATP-binding protein [Planctomycetota bacterium]
MALLLENVKKDYREPDGRPLPILNIKKFQLSDAEQMALVGSSGGGKTTLLNVIAGITAADSGVVSIDGVDMVKLPEAGRDRLRAQRIGFVFQTFHLLQGFTALENVLLGMSFTGQRVDKHRAADLLKRVGLDHRLHHKPSHLSVGEQQRVAVARALVNQPSLLLADEPTASVDLANQELILNIIRETCAEHKVTLLLVTHSADVASIFDRVEKLSDFNQPGAAA